MGKPSCDSETLIGNGNTDSQEARGLSQEAFSDVSSRTYMSTLERDLKSPTLHKLTELCEVMEVHPLTLLTLAMPATTRTRPMNCWRRCARSSGPC
jgi:transcriptional regulator with XRE-family HTH domain